VVLGLSLVSLLFFVNIALIGFNFNVSLGNVDFYNGRIQYMTDSRTVARILSISHSIKLLINKKEYCLVPTDVSRDYRVSVPIVFEFCNKNFLVESLEAKKQLIITLNTASWLRLSLLKL
jgi:hypothetical protein